jgi:hypothetical protein
MAAGKSPGLDGRAERGWRGAAWKELPDEVGQDFRPVHIYTNPWDLLHYDLREAQDRGFRCLNSRQPPIVPGHI